DRRGAQHRMTKSERLGLADVDAIDAVRCDGLNCFEQRRFVPQRKLGFELVGFVEVILDRALVATCDEDHVGDAGGRGLLDRVLDQRFVDDRQHFLRARFRNRQEAGAKAGDGEYRFSDVSHWDSRVDTLSESRALSPASSITFTPSACARSSFEPASSPATTKSVFRSEEHTSELQSRENLVCRLLLEK